MLPRPTAWPTQLAGFGTALAVAFVIDRGWLAGLAGLAVVGAGIVAAQVMATKTHYRLSYAAGAALAVAIAGGWLSGLWISARLAGSDLLPWVRQTSREGLGTRLFFMVLLLLTPLLAKAARRQSFCETCGRLREQGFVAAMPLTKSKIAGFEPLETNLEAAAEQRLQQIYARGAGQELQVKRFTPAADRFVQVLFCRCDSCGSSELRTQWMRKGRRALELVLEEVHPL